MSKGSSGSPPAAPDPAATAQAQAAANKEAAIASSQLNMVNQYTPYGNLEYSERGKSPQGTPQYSVTQTLSPAEQQLLELSNQAATKYGQTANTQLDAVSGRLAQPLDYASLGTAPQANEQTRQNAQDAIIARSQPQMDRDRMALETRLANQGIGLGSDAYSAAMNDYNRAVNDFRLGADVQSGSEMERMFGLESTARNQAINEMLQQRSVPLNELAAMLTGAQVQSPNFVNPPQTQVAPADFTGPTALGYQGALNAYNTNQQSNNAQQGATMGMIGSLAGAAAIAF
jgi:hypothetical protein